MLVYTMCLWLFMVLFGGKICAGLHIGELAVDDVDELIEFYPRADAYYVTTAVAAHPDVLTTVGFQALLDAEFATMVRPFIHNAVNHKEGCRLMVARQAGVIIGAVSFKMVGATLIEFGDILMDVRVLDSGAYTLLLRAVLDCCVGAYEFVAWPLQHDVLVCRLLESVGFTKIVSDTGQETGVASCGVPLDRWCFEYRLAR